MNQAQKDCIEKISSLQPKEHSTVWCVGEQLKDIAAREPDSAQLLLKDLENETMSLAAAEKKIKLRADKNRQKGASSSCVSPSEAEDILREFYGLGGRAEVTAVPMDDGMLDLLNFL